MGKSNNTAQTQIALLQQALSNIDKKIDKIDTRLESQFVTKEEFSPVRNLVYGLVTVILLAVVTALVALVVMPKQ